MSVDDFSPSDADAEAAVWLARLHADTRDPADDRAFRRWIEASSINAEAFRHATAIWDAAGGVSPARFRTDDAQDSRISRRAVLVGGGVLAFAGIGFGGWQQAQAGVYQTELGEQKHVALEDGSLVFLDTDTKLKMNFDSKRREVVLHRGRANFRVAPDPARQFIVAAGSQRVIAPRAVFDVRRDAERVSVVLIDGSATVRNLDGGMNPAGGQLREGERLVAGPAQPGQIDMPDMAQQLAWQNGQIVADNQSLAAMVSEMNRYSRAKLVITDPRAASLRVSGVYRVGDNAAFARSVSQLLPVGVRANDGDLEIFSLPVQPVVPSSI